MSQTVNILMKDVILRDLFIVDILYENKGCFRASNMMYQGRCDKPLLNKKVIFY